VRWRSEEEIFPIDAEPLFSTNLPFGFLGWSLALSPSIRAGFSSAFTFTFIALGEVKRGRPRLRFTGCSPGTSVVALPIFLLLLV
jgi:hypothetical protein